MMPVGALMLPSLMACGPGLVLTADSGSAEADSGERDSAVLDTTDSGETSETGQTSDSGEVRVPSMVIQVRDSYLPGIPIIVRIEIRDSEGRVDRSLWDAEAELSVQDGSVLLVPDRVTLFNGLGSALVQVSGDQDFTLTATVGDWRASRALRVLGDEPLKEVSGLLVGEALTWSGIVRVTGDARVPAGSTLSVLPGTLVLLDGVASGTQGTDLDIEGSIEALGTANAPITFTATDPGSPWGELHHGSADPSVYRYVHLTRGAHSPIGGHTDTGPVVRMVGSAVSFEHCVISDLGGKAMQVSAGSELAMLDCHVARASMGPETDASGVTIEDSWFTEMIGEDDNDGIYFHEQIEGQPLIFRGGVVASGTDDGIDTSTATLTIEDVIVRDWADKGITVYDGTVKVLHSLITDCDKGLSSKSQGVDPVLVTVDHVTFADNVIDVQARNRDDLPDAVIQYVIKNSILWSEQAIQTDYDPAYIQVSYSDLSSGWEGIGNLSSDPGFVDPIGHDYHLAAESPCVDAGDPAGELDADGSVQDQGVFPYR
jgi:hypothetical protein